MRFYAEWLDGEYELLRHLDEDREYDHDKVMDRSLRFHALFGSTIVLSDAQLIDIRTPITKMFNDADFRTFLRERQHFLALTANPATDIKDLRYAISLNGCQRLDRQEKRPKDSFEEAIVRLWKLLRRDKTFDVDRYLNSGTRKQQRRLHQIFRDFARYGAELEGLLHAINFFSNGKLGTTTSLIQGPTISYDTLLKDAQNSLEGRGPERVETVLRTQEREVKASQHGRRAAIRKALGIGEWHNESWPGNNLQIYLDVVHAWNCAINMSVAPDAGTLFESGDDLHLSSYQRTVTDRVDWKTMARDLDRLSNPLQRLLSCDLSSLSWKSILGISRATEATAAALQDALQSGSIEERQEALKAHAENIGDSLTTYPHTSDHDWMWEVAEGLSEKLKLDFIPSGVFKVGKLADKYAPAAVATLHRKLVVNTVMNVAPHVIPVPS